METLRFITLDVFTDTAYEGNPLAVINVPSALRTSLTTERKQRIAREFNLSETVFLHERRKSDPQNEWMIDIFTTTAELSFAGHPTIGSASYLLNSHETGTGSNGTLITKAGRIPISMISSKAGGDWKRVQANIPHNVHIHRHTLGDSQDPLFGLSQNPALAKAERAAPIVSIVKGMTFLLVQLDNLETLAQVEVVGSKLSFEGMLDQGDGWDVGLVARYYFVIGENADESEHGVGKDQVQNIRTRMVESTMEDPATGSAACALCSYLALTENRSSKFEVTQGVEMGRRSVIGVEVVVDTEGKKIQNVRLSGAAVLVMEGELRTRWIL